MRHSFFPEENTILFLQQYTWQTPIDYAVTILLHNPLATTPITTIIYDSTIQCTRDPERPLFFYTIASSRKVMNGQPPQTSLDHIMQVISSLYARVVLQVNAYGQITDISNYKEICTRWKTLRKKLLRDYHTNEAIEDYILLTEIQVYDKELLLHALKKEPFIKYYFGGYYGNSKSIAMHTHYSGTDIYYPATLSYKQTTPEQVTIAVTGKRATTLSENHQLQRYMMARRKTSKTNVVSQLTTSSTATLTVDKQSGQITAIKAIDQINSNDATLKKQTLTILKK
ncbi:hypothetical protein [Aquimarina longa]|uniref:hypothetical protein n=1 Tax=Aquimarina longa TaxID=1080221 RepID=UPI000781FF30|nr:hypothetical protein [Aquimarina longa]